MTTPVRLIDIERHVEDNYRQLKADLDLSWEQLAQRIGKTDRRLVAWMRQQADLEQSAAQFGRSPAEPDADQQPVKEPVSRKAPPKETT